MNGKQSSCERKKKKKYIRTRTVFIMRFFETKTKMKRIVRMNEVENKIGKKKVETENEKKENMIPYVISFFISF